jgi:hypothetical protein
MQLPGSMLMDFDRAFASPRLGRAYYNRGGAKPSTMRRIGAGHHYINGGLNHDMMRHISTGLNNRKAVVGHEGLLHRLQDRLPKWRVEDHQTGYTESGRDSRIDWITPHDELVMTKMTRAKRYVSLDLIKNYTMEELRYEARNHPELMPKTHGSGRNFVNALVDVTRDLPATVVMKDVQNPEWFNKNYPHFKRRPNDNWRTTGYNLYHDERPRVASEPWSFL